MMLYERIEKLRAFLARAEELLQELDPDETMLGDWPAIVANFVEREFDFDALPLFGNETPEQLLLAALVLRLREQLYYVENGQTT